VEGKGVMHAEIEIEVRDKNGKLITKKRMRSHSFVKNFLAWLRRLWKTQEVVSGQLTSFATAISPVEPLDTGGVARGVPQGRWVGATLPPDIFFARIDAGAGEADSGIRVGTGTDVPTVDDVQLSVPILHGSGAGQLSHGATSLDVLGVSGGEVSLKIIRTFTNNSGATITVKELGLHQKSLYTGTTHCTFMLARDVLVAPVDVPNGSTLTVRYILKTNI